MPEDMQLEAMQLPFLNRPRPLSEAEVPNLWQFGTPYTTFCDYQRLNGGTCTPLLALREVRLQEKRNLLQAVCDGKIRGLTALHEAYLRSSA